MAGADGEGVDDGLEVSATHAAGDVAEVDLAGVPEGGRDLSAAVEQLVVDLSDVGELLKRVRLLAGAGESMVVLTHELLAVEVLSARVAVGHSVRHYEHAMQALRGCVVTSLIDEQGMTFTEVARLMSVSTQMVRRLYDLSE